MRTDRIFNNPIIGAITKAATDAIITSARDPRISSVTTSGPAITSQDEAAIKEKVVTEIRDSPELQHITNNEAKWWQKRSRWAMILSALSPFLGVAASYAGISYGENERLLVEEALVSAGGIASVLTALWASYLAYRAGTATKPLGA